jgi:hypothetical protein
VHVSLRNAFPGARASDCRQKCGLAATQSLENPKNVIRLVSILSTKSRILFKLLKFEVIRTKERAREKRED